MISVGPETPLKILFVEAAPSVGGSTKLVLDMLRALDRKRFAARLLTTIGPSELAPFVADLDLTIEYAQAAREQPVQDARFGNASLEKLRRYGLALPALVRNQLPAFRETWASIRRFQADLVVTNNALWGNLPDILAARLARRPCIAAVRVIQSPSCVEGGLARGVSALVGGSEAICEALRANLVVDTARIHCIFDGIFPEAFGEEAPSRAAVASGDYVACCLGRLVGWKGQHVFLDAVHQASPELPQLRAVVVGSGPEAAALRRRAAKLGIADRVVFTGFRSDTDRILAESDVLVHCSTLPEPGGTVVLEAMGAGKPVIAADAGGPRSFVDDPRTGLLTPPGDADALARALVELGRDPERRRSMGAAGRERVRTLFDVRKNIQSWEALFLKACGRGEIPVGSDV